MNACLSGLSVISMMGSANPEAVGSFASARAVGHCLCKASCLVGIATLIRHPAECGLLAAYLSEKSGYRESGFAQWTVDRCAGCRPRFLLGGHSGSGWRAKDFGLV